MAEAMGLRPSFLSDLSFVLATQRLARRENLLLVMMHDHATCGDNPAAELKSSGTLALDGCSLDGQGLAQHLLRMKG